MASGSPEHHVDWLGYRLGDRPGNPVLAAEERIGNLRWREQPLLSILLPSSFDLNQPTRDDYIPPVRRTGMIWWGNGSTTLVVVPTASPIRSRHSRVLPRLICMGWRRGTGQHRGAPKQNLIKLGQSGHLKVGTLARPA
jgi:hypothetical protein